MTAELFQDWIDHTMTDDEIILAVCDGHIRQYEILIERYSKKIVTFIYRMIGDRDEANNLTQDVFLNIYENLAFYKPENNFWLISTASPVM